MTAQGARGTLTQPSGQPGQTSDAPLARQVDLLASILLRQNQCDAQTIDRGRRVAAESGQRLDLVLIQLGLVTERGLAEAYATLLGAPLAGPARFPEAPLFPERLTPRFLRTARACPLAWRTTCSSWAWQTRWTTSRPPPSPPPPAWPHGWRSWCPSNWRPPSAGSTPKARPPTPNTTPRAAPAWKRTPNASRTSPARRR